MDTFGNTFRMHQCEGGIRAGDAGRRLRHAQVDLTCQEHPAVINGAFDLDAHSFLYVSAITVVELGLSVGRYHLRADPKPQQ